MKVDKKPKKKQKVIFFYIIFFFICEHYKIVEYAKTSYAIKR